MFRRKDDEKKEIALQAFYDLEDAIVRNLLATDKLIAFTSTSNHTDQLLNIYVMAKHLAEEENKILLIDANLRGQELADFLGKNKERGFIDGVLGEYTNEEIISSDENIKNLDLMFTGKVSDYADQFLEPNAIRNFLAQVKEKYDYVFINTTANTGIPEANMFAVLCDKTVLFTAYANKDNEVFDNSIKELQNVHADIIGVVITNYVYSEKEVEEMFGEI